MIFIYRASPGVGEGYRWFTIDVLGFDEAFYGTLAQIYSYERVFLFGLAIPAISLTGAMLVRLDGVELKPVDWRILGGGLAFGAVVLAIGLGGVPLGQELIFIVSLAVIALMLARIGAELDETHRKRRIIRPTEAGKRLFVKIRDLRRSYFQSLMGGLSGVERHQLDAMLEKIAHRLVQSSSAT